MDTVVQKNGMTEETHHLFHLVDSSELIVTLGRKKCRNDKLILPEALLGFLLKIIQVHSSIFSNVLFLVYLLL